MRPRSVTAKLPGWYADNVIDSSQLAELYERYGKPLEREHFGRYVAVFPDGRLVLGESILQVTDEAVSRFGRGAIVFKIGEGAAGRWRLTRLS